MRVKVAVLDRLAMSTVIVYVTIWLLLFVLAIAPFRTETFGFEWIPIWYWSFPSARWIASTAPGIQAVIFGGLCNGALLYGSIRFIVFAVRRMEHTVSRDSA